MKISGVLWDMDGTLIDSEPTAVRALLLAAEEADITVPESVKDRVVGMSADDIYRWFQKDFGLKMPANRWEERKRFHYFESHERIEAFDDAVAAWRDMDDAGIPQAIVSNSARAIVDFNCEKIGISRPGLISISRDDVVRGKPDPAGYLSAAMRLSVKNTECAVMEDSLSGIEAGRAAGMHAFLVPHSNEFMSHQSCRMGSMDQLGAEIVAKCREQRKPVV